MKGIKLISVIVPVYKVSAQLLKKSISLLAGHSDIEIVIVFDGKPNYDNEELSWFSEQNNVELVYINHAGVSCARNAGIEFAHGEWITFLDADDSIDYIPLRNAALYGSEHYCDIVQTAFRVELEHSVEHKHYMLHNTVFSSTDQLAEVRTSVLSPDRGTANVWGKLYSTSFIRENHIKFEPDIVAGEDTLFAYDAFQHASCVGYLSEEMYIYQRRLDSAVTNYSEDYGDRLKQYLHVMKARVSGLNDPKYWNAYHECVLYHMVLIMMHQIFNPANPNNQNRIRLQFRELIDESMFKSSLQTCNLSNFSLSKRIFLTFVKLRSYYGCKVICAVRNRQLGRS